MGLVLEADLAAVERIEQKVERIALVADEKGAGETHTLERQTEPPSDFENYDAQRERDAESAIEHVVQKTVSGVVVRLLVTGHLPAHVERVDERVEDHEWRRLIREPVL